MARRELSIEGDSVEELLALPKKAVADFVCVEAPVTFRIGTATFLGEFRLLPNRLVAEIAHVAAASGIPVAVSSGVVPSRALPCKMWELRNVRGRLGSTAFIQRLIASDGVTLRVLRDAMAEAARTGRSYQTRLDPPPADPRVAHPDTRPAAEKKGRR